MRALRVLAIEPYYGGSHKAFIDGWQGRSRHQWTVLTLPASKWKWRMRHAAVTFADRLSRDHPGRRWDVLFCSDMLNLAEFRGLWPTAADMPSVAYFHENQLTYPVRREDERDFQFAFTNMTTALAAREVWFNSAYHRDSFLSALAEILRRMPDYRPTASVQTILAKSRVWPQGVDEFPARTDRPPGPLRILWAARWEHDKAPEDFFEAIRRLRDRGVDFRLSVIGQRFRDVPPVFAGAEREFSDHIDHWGYQADRAAYTEALLAADVVVSTAKHEFFGVAVAEAIAAGAYPVVPKRLAYPELLQLDRNPQAKDFFYDAGPEDLAERLAELAEAVRRDQLWAGDPGKAMRIVRRFSWPRLAGALDESLQQAARGPNRGYETDS